MIKVEAVLGIYNISVRVGDLFFHFNKEEKDLFVNDHIQVNGVAEQWPTENSLFLADVEYELLY
ncbi:MAG: hypothetical protein Q4C54_04015 [Clostridia bacterium]|nr:hypothetical protein [Clostridia bacterium]